MKKSALLFLLLLCMAFSYAQYGVTTLEKPEMVKKTETIVVVDYELPENRAMEESLEKALKKAWKICPYKIMDKNAVLSNIKKYYKSSSYSFIFIQYDKINKYGFQPLNRSLLLSLTITNKADAGSEPQVTALAKSELNYDICDIESELVKDLWILQDQINTGGFKFTEASSLMKTRTLLIPANLVGKMTKEEITKEYPYPFQIVTKEELSKAILDQTPNTCFVEHTNIPQPMVTIIDIPSAKVLYHGAGEVPIYGFGRTLKILKDHIK